jgi:predicted dithiol-disulfide oxidoreductase (DUF899 family)
VDVCSGIARADRRIGETERRRLSQRRGGVQTGPQRASCGRDRTAAAYRACGGPAAATGGAVLKDYRFDGEHGRVSLRDLFGDRETLVVYSYMFGPHRQKPCPMCTSLLAAWEGNAPNIEQRVALAVVARSPIEKILAAKKAFGWTQLKMYSDGEGDFTRDYVSATDEDTSRYTVFKRDGDAIRHFWSDEINDAMADPGQDPRGAPDPDPLWLLLDNTPEGRGADWRPQLILKSAL